MVSWWMCRGGVVLLAVVLGLSCRMVRVSRSASPYLGAVGYGPLIIAHRGGALEAPENTLTAFSRAVDLGADWLELDVHLAADGTVVVIHDYDVERTTDGRGAVAEKTSADLHALDAGRPKITAAKRLLLQELGVEPPVFARGNREPVPTLAEVFALSDTRVMIELKVDATTDRRALAAAVVQVIHQAQAHARVLLASFDPKALWAVYDLEPSLPLIGISRNTAGTQAMLGLPVVALAARLDHLQEALQLAPAGIAVWTWTLYSPAMVEQAVAQGAHGLITDIPQATLSLVRPPPQSQIER